VGIAYFFKAPKDPLKLLIIGWLTVALVALVDCRLPDSVSGYVVNVAQYVVEAPLPLAVLRIFLHNLVVLVFCAVLGRAYLGFVLASTALVSRQLAGGYPLEVVLGAHTLLEIYAYSLATTRRKRDLVNSVVYLMVAAMIEVIAIRF